MQICCLECNSFFLLIDAIIKRHERVLICSWRFLFICIYFNAAVSTLARLRVFTLSLVPRQSKNQKNVALSRKKQISNRQTGQSTGKSPVLCPVLRFCLLRRALCGKNCRK
jgi:hypothetical protein